MTREKAINDWIILAIKNMWNEKKCKEILEVLEQEPCDDAISRQAVLDAMYALCNTGETLKENPWRDNPHIDAITDAIDDLPPVTPQPKTGHWIEYTRVLIPEPFNKYEQAWYCSECGYGNQECEDGSAWLEWKYCPNCGAKMESEE